MAISKFVPTLSPIASLIVTNIIISTVAHNACLTGRLKKFFLIKVKKIEQPTSNTLS